MPYRSPRLLSAPIWHPAGQGGRLSRPAPPCMLCRGSIHATDQAQPPANLPHCPFAALHWLPQVGGGGICPGPRAAGGAGAADRVWGVCRL